MATNTTNYNLIKPAHTDTLGDSLDDFNSNADTIDATMHQLQTDLTSLSNKIGTYVIGTNATSLSVPSGTSTTISTINLTPGVWVVTGGFQFSTSAQGKLCNGAIANSTPSVIAGTTVRFDGNGGGGYDGTTILNLSSNASYLLRAYQSSGSTMTATNVTLRAVRIK